MKKNLKYNIKNKNETAITVKKKKKGISKK